MFVTQGSDSNEKTNYEAQTVYMYCKNLISNLYAHLQKKPYLVIKKTQRTCTFVYMEHVHYIMYIMIYIIHEYQPTDTPDPSAKKKNMKQQ